MENIEIHPNYKAFEHAITTTISKFHTSGTVVVNGNRNVIKLFKIKNLHINVKHFKIPNRFNAFVYKYLRKSKARRSFEYANILISKGIRTPFPVAYYEEMSTFGLKQSYYLSLHIDYDFDFRVLIHKPQFPDRVLILKQFTAFTHKLHENNIEFLDHSPGNTLIVKQSNTHYDFYLIDLNRMRFKIMNFRQRMKNFKRLWLSKTMVRIIAQSYSEMANYKFDKTYRVLLTYSRAFQKSKNAKKLRRLRRRPRFKT